MREVIIIKSLKKYYEEEKKIYQMIYQRADEIAKEYPDIPAVESNMRATYQLMREEKIPHLIMYGGRIYKQYIEEHPEAKTE